MGTPLDALSPAKGVDHSCNSAHAAGAPWEAINALDAAVLAWAKLASQSPVVADAFAQVQ